MSNILERRLVDCGILPNDILNHIDQKNLGEKGVFVYTSHLEGLGTKNSDLDVYVITERIDSLPNVKFENNVYTENVLINNVLIDIEYREESTLIESIERVNNLKINIDVNEIKFIDKLEKSVILNEEFYSKDIKGLINKEFILRRVKQYYMQEANSYFRDAINLYHNEEYPSALFCARNALEFSLGILNTENGYSNVKNKWLSKIFLLSQPESSELSKKYLSMQIFHDIKKENIVDYLEELLEFIQEIITKGSLKNH